MSQFRSAINNQSKEYKENFSYMSEEVSHLKKTIQEEQEGRDEAIAKHEKRGKFTVRERIEKLIDKGSYFLEFSRLAGYGLYEGGIDSGGVVTGVGLISGRECVVVANDATVKGGTYFPITVKKHLRAQEIAEENGLPCVYLVDSGGAFLPLQAEVFPDRDHFGRIFYNQSRMSAKGIPQISAVLGSCTAGGAYIPALSDENVIVKGNGTIFLGGPPLVAAATGEKVTAEDLGGASVHCEKSGVTDHFAETEIEALEKIRDIIKRLGSPDKEPFSQREFEEPLFRPEELYGIVPRNKKQEFDIREIIVRVVDAGSLDEFKEKYGKTVVTCFASIWGMPVGIVANNGILFSESALKATHFIEMCDKRKIPIVFLQNITGFMVGKRYENEGIAKHGAKMVAQVSNLRVPKFTVIIRGSFGAGNYGMCGRGFQPRQLWLWPTAKTSVMGGEQAAEVLLQVKKEKALKTGKVGDEKKLAEIKDSILKKYEQESSAYYSTARLWDDGIIDPLDTRKVLALGLRSSYNKKWPEQMSYAIHRM